MKSCTLYQNSSQPVTYVKRYRPPGFTEEQAYESIYFLNPTKSAEISFPDKTIGYRIVECAVDRTVYNTVKINGEEVPEDRRTEIMGLISYSSDLISAENRPTISFDNHVSDNVIKDLYITKKLPDKDNNGVEQTPMQMSGGSFTMKHGDTVEIMLPTGSEVTVAEDNEGYSTPFKLSGQPAQSGDSIGFTLSEETVLSVKNTLDGEIATGLSSTVGRSPAMIVISAAPIGYVLYHKRKRKAEAIC